MRCSDKCIVCYNIVYLLTVSVTIKNIRRKRLKSIHLFVREIIETICKPVKGFRSFNVSFKTGSGIDKEIYESLEFIRVNLGLKRHIRRRAHDMSFFKQRVKESIHTKGC